MANVITQFLIGIGYDYDDKGERQAKAGMEAIKSSTLAIGSALSAAAIGASVRVDQLAEKSRKLQDQLYRTNTPTTWVQGYQASLRELGADADTAGDRVVDIERMLAGIKMGDAAFLEPLGRAGLDTNALSQAKDAQDFITQAADQFSRATHTQRVNMASVLHLTDQEFKLWEQGGSYVNSHSEQLAKQLGYTDALNEKQYEYSQSWVELNLELDKAGNTISSIMLPGMTGLVDQAKEYVNVLNQFAKDNPETTATGIQTAGAIGAGAAVLTGGKVLSKVPGFGSLGKLAGPAGAVIGGGLLADSAWDSIMNFNDATYGNETTGGGNFKANSPLGKAWDFSSDLLMGVWGDLTAPPPMWQSGDRHRRNVDRLRSNPLTSSGAPYVSGGTDYERQNEHLARTLRDSPIRVDNNLTMNATVELDGQKIGEVIDNKINENNQQALYDFDSQVNR